MKLKKAKAIKLWAAAQSLKSRLQSKAKRKRLLRNHQSMKATRTEKKIMTGKNIRIIRREQEKEDQTGTGKTMSAKYVARQERNRILKGTSNLFTPQIGK